MSTLQERMNDEGFEIFGPTTIIDFPLEDDATEEDINAFINLLYNYSESPEKTKALKLAYDLKNRL